ncbi:MAG: 4-hydroxy-tetrahydrodipicolinate reductase [bacterium]
MTAAEREDRTLSIFAYGALGRMGRLVLEAAAGTPRFRAAGGVDVAAGDDVKNATVPVYDRFPETLPDDTVVVDFSTRGAVGRLVADLGRRGIPLVSGTTGLGDDELEALRVYSEHSPVFYDTNMSYGVSVMKRMLGVAGPLMRGNADVEIVEMHHSGKRDFPSGTAYAIARVIDPDAAVVVGREVSGEPGRPAIHVHSGRLGGIFGDHRVIFASDDEMITLEHRALTRAVFAKGALRAARFVAGKKKGMFSMKDLLEVQNE